MKQQIQCLYCMIKANYMTVSNKFYFFQFSLKFLHYVMMCYTCFVLKADSEEITSSCYAAKIQIEDSCPSTRSGWIHQAKLKQCSNIVLPCQKQLILEYHCLPNTWQNRTISVCTLPKFINGKSLYNMLKANAKENVHSI